MAQLFLYRAGRRGDAVMLEQAKGLGDADLRSLSERISRLAPPPVPAQAPDAARYRRGGAIAGERRCASCHGADLSGGQNVPRLANQREDYTLKALREYRSGTRIGYGNAVMPETVVGLGDAELSDLAHFIAYFRR
jgi:cytochrome c553